MPELASDLDPAELDLVMEMENNIAKAQQQSLQRRRWNPESVDDVEQYLRDTVQASTPPLVLVATNSCSQWVHQHP